jgi:hypothetical protein
MKLDMIWQSTHEFDTICTIIADLFAQESGILFKNKILL